MISGLVSTIIPVYNRPEMLKDAVQSVLDQTYRPIEIIIVDDGSTDETPSVAQIICSNNHEVSLITIENSGPGLAREAGRKIAKGEFIQYLDSDDLLKKNKFSIQVDGLNTHTDCGVSYCIQQYSTIDGEILDPAWMRSGEHHKTMFPAMLGGRLWGTPTPLYRKCLIDECGPWLDLKSEEDWEYDCRIASKGVKLHYANKPLVVIREHNGTHFGQLKEGRLLKSKDRAVAYQTIFKHSLNAQVDQNNFEFRLFIKSVFLHSRNCAAIGLKNESRNLFLIAYECSKQNHHRLVQYYIYNLGIKLVGYRLMGKLSIGLDKLRA